MKIRILLFLTLLSSYAFGQALTDAQMTTQVETNIRAITAAGGITKGAVTDAFESLINNKLNKNEVQYVVATGTNTYAATLSPAIASYVAGQKLFVNFTNANTGASTINVNSLGVIAIKKNVSSALVAGDLPAGGIGLLVYDGTNFQLLGVMPVDASGSVKGVLKLYTATGSNTDGAMDQNSTTTALAGKLSGTLSPAHIFVGNGSSIATDLPITGAISMSSAGVTTYAGDLPVNKLNGGTGASSTTEWAGDGTWKHRFTNAAGSNELIGSNGTDGVATGIFFSGSGDASFGTGIAGSERNFNATGSDADVGFRFNNKGNGNISSTVVGSGYHSWMKRNSGTSDIPLHSRLERQSSGTVANGFGLYSAVQLQNASGSSTEDVRWNYSLSDAANTSEDVLIDLQAIRNGTLSTAWSWNNNNFSFFTNTGSYGGGEKVIGIPNAITNPSTSVTGGGVFYVKSSDNKPYWWTGTTEYPMIAGSSAFTGLTDGPGSFTGKSLNFARVNTGETALEYQTPAQVRADISAEAKVTVTAEKTVSYTASANEIVPADLTSGNFVLTLPTAPPDGTRVGAKIVKPTSSLTYTYTVNTGGSDVFNRSGGPTTSVLSIIGQAQNYKYRSSGAVWVIDGDDLPLPQLDTRYFYTTVNAQTASYTPVLTDAGKRVEINNASANTFTIPTNASVAYPIGTVMYVMRTGAGQTTFVPPSGGSLTTTSGGLTDAGLNGLMRLEKTATDSWLLQNGQPLPTELAYINSLTPSDGDFIYRSGGAWVRKTTAETATIISAALNDPAGMLNFDIYGSSQSFLTLTNQTNAELGFNNFAGNTRYVDLSGFNYVQVAGQIAASSASANSPRLYASYSLDNATYVQIGSNSGGDIISMATTGQKISNWIALPTAAKALVYIRVAQNGGDGVADPQVGSLSLRFKK